MPFLMVVGAAVLSYLTVKVDHLILPWVADSGWLWAGSPQAARDMLTTIAGSMITVVGVTFSITVVALTLAASQFGPRLLRNFMRDIANQIVLGTFVATFLYCLLALRAVRSFEGELFVPNLSVTLGLVFAVVSLGVLIFFIHHVAMSLQSENLAAAIAEDMQNAIDRLFPEKLGQPPEKATQPEVPCRAANGRQIYASTSGYVETIANEQLMEAAEQHDLLLWLDCTPGQFITRGNPLLTAAPGERCDDAVAEELARSFVLGRHRTPTQDVNYSAQQLVSIAVRALSPGINDPFTAINCIDWLGNGLAQLAQRKIPSSVRTGRGGEVRVIARPTEFPELADVAFNQIRRSASGHISVMIRMLETLAAIGRHAARVEDRVALRTHLDLVAQEARRGQHQARELAELTRIHREVLILVERGVAPGKREPDMTESDRA